MSLHQRRTRRRQDHGLDPSIINVLPANIAVLDAQGTTLAVNESRERFAAANGFTGDGYVVNLNYLQYHVSAWNMHHESAVDAPSALALLRQAAADGRPFDLAIIDMHLPDIGGLQLCPLIKEDPSIRSTTDRPDGVRSTRRRHRGEGSRCQRLPSPSRFVNAHWPTVSVCSSDERTPARIRPR